MNLHKAKGLEATVVFLADPCGDRWRHVSKRVERHADGARGWFSIEKDGEGYGEKVSRSPPVGTRRSRRSCGTSMPRKRACATSPPPAPASCSSSDAGRSRADVGPWGTFDPFLAGVPELPVPAKRCRAGRSSAEDFGGVAAAANVQRESAHGHAREATWSVTSVTAEARHIAKMARPIDAMPDDPTQVVSADTPARRADAGMAWGTLIHGLLEHAMRHKDASREDLRRLALWLTVEEPQLRAVIDEALDTVERAARADFWSVAQSHARFCGDAIHGHGCGRLTNGVIDLLFESDAGWQVVDYKTDRSIEEGRYAAQLEAYKAALRKVGCAVAGASVVNVRTENQVSFTRQGCASMTVVGRQYGKPSTPPCQRVIEARQAWSPCSCAQAWER